MKKLLIALILCACLTFPATASYEHGTVTSNFGKIVGVNETGDDITVTTAGTYYQYVTEDEAVVTGVIYDSGNHALQMSMAGHFLTTINLSVSVDSGDHTVHVGIGKNGTVGTYNSMDFKVKFADRPVPISITTITNLAVGDDITIEITSDTNGDVVSVYHCQLTVVFLD